MVVGDWNYSVIVVIDVLLLRAGEPRDGDVVFDGERAPHILRRHLDTVHVETVHGLDLAQKLRIASGCVSKVAGIP